MKAGRVTIWMGAVVMGIAMMARGAVGATLEEAWERLGSRDAKVAEEAEVGLRGQGEAGARFIAGKLTVVAEEKEVAKLIGQLDDEQFKVREAAQARLLGLGQGAGRMLQEALSTARSAESGARLQGLVEKLRGMRRPEGEEGQRQTRGVRIVQASGPGAGDLLRKIGAGGTWESTRNEAMAALYRMRMAEAEGMLDGLTQAAAGQKDTTEAEAAVRVRLREMGLLDDARVQARLARVAEMRKAVRQRAELEGRLRAEPGNGQVRESLVTLLLVEMNEPGAAQMVAAEGAVGEPLRSAVGLAAKKLEHLTLAEKEELARYFIVASKLSVGAGKASALDRAGTLLALCLADTTLEAGQTARLRNELAAVQADLDKLDVGEGGWSAGLAKVDLWRDVRAGEWSWEMSGAHVRAGDFAVLDVPLKMPGSYELSVRLTRHGGTDGVFIGFPVGKARADLNIGGWGNGTTGLEIVSGRAANAGDANVKRNSGIENGKSYEYRIRVAVGAEGASIVAMENGKLLARWNGREEALSCEAAWHAETQSGVGIGAHRSEVLFERVHVRELGAE